MQMSVAWYIVGEKEIEGFDPFVNGKAIAHADEKTLAGIFKSLKVPPLMDFFSQSAEEIGDLFDDEEEIPDDSLDEEWFLASEGLKTVRALTEHLKNHPGAIDGSNEILEDLKEFERVLTQFEEERVRWHLAIDF
jgi:hypothetical protein